MFVRGSSGGHVSLMVIVPMPFLMTGACSSMTSLSHTSMLHATHPRLVAATGLATVSAMAASAHSASTHPTTHAAAPSSSHAAHHAAATHAAAHSSSTLSLAFSFHLLTMGAVLFPLIGRQQNLGALLSLDR
jgi:hydroxyethylthiazole kinase-like sugar kinase family protein